MQSDILEFYGWNRGIAITTILWDTCKAFSRGKLILLKAFRLKEKSSVRLQLKLEIEKLESEFKQNPASSKVEQLDVGYDALKLLDASQITQEI